MVAGCMVTSSLWCAGIATFVGIRTLVYASDSMHCSGGWLRFQRRSQATVDSTTESAPNIQIICGLNHSPQTCWCGSPHRNVELRRVEIALTLGARVSKARLLIQALRVQHLQQARLPRLITLLSEVQ